MEGGSRSNSSHSSQEIMENSASANVNIVPTITILSPNNGRSNNDFEKLSNKRESENLDKEKGVKIARISESGQLYEKENVDPRRILPPVSFFFSRFQERF